MSNEVKNIISPGSAVKHDIAKYNFKIMTQNDVLSDKKIKEKYDKDIEYGIAQNNENTTVPPTPAQKPQESPQQQPVIQEVQQPINNEIIEALLSKSDKLAESLAKLQLNMEKQNEDFEKRISEQKQESYEKGLKEGIEKAEAENEQKFNTLKESFLDSIKVLNEKLKELESGYLGLEKELSSVAVDISKEVIVSEVSERGEEIALALSKALIENLKEATSIKLKLNPKEAEFVKSNLESDSRVKIESDKAIAKGGVVIISDSGNIDGSVLSRYQNLKNSILESRKEDG